MNKSGFACYLLAVLTLSAYRSMAITLDDKEEWETLYCSETGRVYAGGKNVLQYFEYNKTLAVSLPGPMTITALYEFSGQVLAGTDDGTILLYETDSGKWKNAGKLRAAVSAIAPAHNGILVGTNGAGLVLITPGSIKFMHEANSGYNNYIYKILADANQVQTSSDMGITLLGDKEFYRTLNTLLPDIIVTAFSQYANSLFIGTQKGYLLEYNNGNLRYLDQGPWKGGVIHDIMVLDSKLVVATNSGAFVSDIRTGMVIDTLYRGNRIHSIALDQSGAVWLAGDGFLGSFYTGFFETMLHNTGNVHAVILDNEHNAWFTPDQGLIKYNVPKRQLTPVRGTLSSKHADITSLYMAPSGEIWAGTSGEGLLLVEKNKNTARRIHISDHTDTDNILGVSGRNDSIWVTTLDGIWYTDLKEEPFRFYSVEKELQVKKYFAFSLLPLDPNTYLVATDGDGLIRIDLKNKSAVREDGIASPVIYSVLKDSSAQVWCAAHQDGLYCLKGERILHLNDSNGLQHKDITSIHVLNDSNIAAISAKGADVIDIRDFSVVQVPLTINELECVPELNSITGKENSIMFGSDRSLMKFSLPAFLKNRKEKIHISSLQVGDSVVSLSRHQFTHREDYFKFEFGIKADRMQKKFLRYRLEGLNDKWSDIQSSEVVFPRLRPGQYTFVAEIANNPGFLNAGSVRYSFRILQPYWLQWWFLLLSSVIALISAYRYLRYRERKASRIQLLEKEKAVAEFEVLKTQVNPHFLFNSFNTLMQVIDEDPVSAMQYTQNLSDFYRSLVSIKEKEVIALRDEVELLNKYFFLQKMRFGDALILEIDLQLNDLESEMIPPLTLQMLAENAIKHNRVTMAQPLQLKLFATPGSIVFQNTLQLKTSSGSGEKLGLQNIRNRYRHKWNTDIRVHIDENTFSVYLPKNKLA